MRSVFRSGPGKIELNWMWLPAFIAHSSADKRYLEEKLKPELIGKPLTDETLDFAHERVLDFICERHKAIVGLRNYLDSVKFIEDETR